MERFRVSRRLWNLQMHRKKNYRPQQMQKIRRKRIQKLKVSPSVSPTPDIEEQRRKEQEEADRKAQEEEEQRQQEEAGRRQEEEAAAKAGNPKIILKSTTVNATAGQLPAWIDAVGSFQDDKDGYETLFKNLKASKYDVNARGDHAVTLTTTDSDGNVSDPVSVTVHVK